jgi:hypothetical protein
MVSASNRLALRPLLGALAVGVALLVSACGDTEGEPGDSWATGEEGGLGLSSSRTVAEERIAEDMEALLPGLWVWQGGADQPESSLEIMFLGHDARTGDIAMLVETANARELHPARVVITESHGTLQFPDSDDAYVVERIDVDRLVLQDVETNARLFYRRVE